MTETIGIIGLGNMGQAMAENLLGAGYKLRVWNRSVERAAPLIARGAALERRPEDVVEKGGVVISSLSDDRALHDVIGVNTELMERLGPDGIHVSTSTVSPEASRNLAQAHKANGGVYVTATVLGRPDAAAARKLWVILSGPSAAKARVNPLLKHLGQGVFDLGEDPALASVAKLASNFVLASAMEAMGEAFAFAEKNGLERVRIYELISQTVFACPAYQNYGRQIAERNYEPARFKLTLGMKDIRLALQAADASQVPMPLASLLHNHFLSAVANGRGHFDWTGIAAEASVAAGLPATAG